MKFAKKLSLLLGATKAMSKPADDKENDILEDINDNANNKLNEKGDRDTISQVDNAPLIVGKEGALDLENSNTGNNNGNITDGISDHNIPITEKPPSSSNNSPLKKSRSRWRAIEMVDTKPDVGKTTEFDQIYILLIGLYDTDLYKMKTIFMINIKNTNI